MNDTPKAAVSPTGTVMGVVPRCPICGTQAWTLVRPPDLKEGETYQEITTVLRDGALIGMSVRQFVCENCGFVRQHNETTYKP
jgi:hypothetical protein